MVALGLEDLREGHEGAGLRGCCLSKEAGQAVSNKPCGAGQGRETPTTLLWIKGTPRAQSPDGLHSLLKAPVCVPGSPDHSCQQLCQAVWVFRDGPHRPPRDAEPQPCLSGPSVIFVTLSSFCDIPSNLHCWGPHISPETTPGHCAPSPG